jgi:serine/threonine protein phosphatase 1
MTYIAIGDIHGCAKTLRKLIDSLPLNNETHLVFIGDYIDRGPDTKGVIDFLLDLKLRYTCTFLRGNHEQMMLDALNGVRERMWLRSGGFQSLESYQAKKGEFYVPQEHFDFVFDTKLFLDTPMYFFVHGGIYPHLSVKENIEKADLDFMMWERSHLSAKNKWEKTVICGHTPQEDGILKRKNLICIDTGCVFAGEEGLGQLTAILLPSEKVVAIDYCEEE